MAFPASHHASFGTSVKSEPRVQDKTEKTASAFGQPVSQHALMGGGSGVLWWQTSVVAVVVVVVVVRVSESGELHQPSTIIDQGPSASRDEFWLAGAALVRLWSAHFCTGAPVGRRQVR
jgi:hypothetical protein